MSIESGISRLLEHPTRALTARELRGLGPLGELLRQWGALQELDPPVTIRCRACDEDHEAALEFDRCTGAYCYYCGYAGFVRVEDADVRVFRFDHEWLMSRLSTGLKIGRPRHRELVANTLWDLGDAGLGDAGSGGRPWAAFLARAVSATLDAIIDALQTRGRKLPGFVWTSSPDAAWHLVLPHGYRFKPLDDILEVRAGTLEVAADSVLAGLRGRHAGERRKKGRPTDRSIVLEIFERRLATGQTIPQVKREAEAIRDELLAEQGSALRSGAVGTIEKIISERHRVWRSNRAQTTK